MSARNGILRMFLFLFAISCLLFLCVPLPASAQGNASQISSPQEDLTTKFVKKSPDTAEKAPGPFVQKAQGDIAQDQPEEKIIDKRYTALNPRVLLGDLIDVKVEKLADEAVIKIITNTPLLFETSKGISSDDVNYLPIILPNMRLAWTDGEQASVVVGHSGIKEIILTQLYNPKVAVEATVVLLPETSYNIVSPFDANGIYIKARRDIAKKPAAVSKEKLMPSVPEKLISIDVVDADIQHVLKIVSEQGDVNIVSSNKVKGQITAKLENVTVDTALDVLLGVNGYSCRKIGDTLLVGPEEDIAKRSAVSEALHLEHISADMAKDMIIGIIPERSIQSNSQTNSIVITTTPEKIKEIKSIISQIDKPIPQVQLTARIIEVSSDMTKELGIDWSTGIGVTFREQDLVPSFGDAAITGAAPFFRMYQFARTAFEAKLKALVSDGDARILSSPRIVTMKDKEANIFIGDRIPYTVNIISGGATTTEVRFVEPGIRLRMTPRVVNDEFVVLDIAPEVSFIFSFRGPNEEYPWVKTREANANVRIQNGQTLILGGLLSKEDKENISKVPFLGDVPFLGNAFKSNKKVNNEVELLIVVTPTILM
jgi:type IV pilus assembly protein PilQ